MNNPFSRALRYYIRYLIQLPSSYSPDGSPHIFIFSSRRSGSTLLRDMIASQPHFNYIDEPLNFGRNQYNPYKRLFLENQRGQIISLDQKKEKILQNYIEMVLARKYVTRSQWRFFDKNYHWLWKRYVVKELNAKNLIPCFEDYFKDRIKIIYHIRHPFAVAASLLERNWEHYFDVFMEDEEYSDKYITPKIRSIYKKVMRAGSEAEKYILDWCFENNVPLKLYRNRSWITVSYERVVSETLTVSENLCRTLDLPDIDAMVEVVRRPSSTTLTHSRAEINNFGPEIRVSAWQHIFNPDEVNGFSEILDAFEVDLYSYKSIYPKEGFDNRC